MCLHPAPHCLFFSLQRYVDLEQIGAGSFGAVYKARDTGADGGSVAIKVFHSADQEVRIGEKGRKRGRGNGHVGK